MCFETASRRLPNRTKTNTKKADVFSFGVLAFELFSRGMLLFTELPTCASSPDVTEAYAARVTDALSTLWGCGAQVFVLGGDHGVTIPALDALERLIEDDASEA